MSSIKGKRIHILSPYEISELYERPHFNTTERIEAFSLDNETLSLIQRKQKIETKVYVILMLGYFRFKPAISHFRFDEVFEDLSYVCSKYFPNRKMPQKDLSKRSRSNVADIVLELVNFSQYNKKKHYQQLLARVKDVATICIDPRYIFDECLAFFGQERIALPGYTSIQDIVSKALTSERQRVTDVLAVHLSDKAKKYFKETLFAKAAIDPLIAIKTSPRDFSKAELANEIQTHQVIRKIYPELKHVIKSLQLSQGNLEYYAAQVKNKPASRLRNYKEPHALLYLSCFLYFRYMETNDNLVDAFRYLTRKQKETAQLIAKQEVADKLAVIQEKLQVAGNLIYLFIDESVSDSTEFGAIRKRAFELISEKDIQIISQHLHKNDFNKAEYEWKFIEKQSRKIAGTLRKLFLNIDIECESDDILIKQIQDAKNELDKHGKIISVDQRG